MSMNDGEPVVVVAHSMGANVFMCACSHGVAKRNEGSLFVVVVHSRPGTSCIGCARRSPGL